MRLEFESNVADFPQVEDHTIESLEFASAVGFDAILKKGITAAQNGDRDLARKLLSQTTAMNPANETAWLWLASISDYPEELLAFLDRVLDINPSNARAVEWRAATNTLLAKTFAQRAIAALEKGSPELVDQCLAQAFTYDGDCESAWALKASLAETEEQKLEFFEHVLTINPGNSEALCAVAKLNRAQSQASFELAKDAAATGDRQKATAILEEFLQNTPDSVDGWILKSHLAQSVDEKIEALNTAAVLDPENEAVKSGLAYLELTFGAIAAETESAFDFAENSDEQLASESDSIEFEMPTAGSHNISISSLDTIYDPGFAVESFFESSDDKPIESSESENMSSDPEDGFLTDKPAMDFNQTILFKSSDFETSISDDTDIAENIGFTHDADNLDSADLELANLTVEVEDFVNATTDEFRVEAEPVPVPAEETVEDIFDANAGSPKSDTETTVIACQFCKAANDPFAFECNSCFAILTFADLERVLSNSRADQTVVQNAVTQMEAEWNLREFDEIELTTLSLGHFNLRNYDAAFKYLQEASRLDPNNVILAGHVNTLAIRLDEMRRQSEIHEAMPKGKTILVVDDSPTVRKLISGKLEKSGHIVICSPDGVDALEMIEDGMPDLVLLDIAMPRMDGYEVCKQIRAKPEGQDLPIVMISGKDGFFDKVRGRMAGATGYITKPFGPETLMKALETYLLPEEVQIS